LPDQGGSHSAADAHNCQFHCAILPLLEAAV
jgi:hypothetical protein